MFDHFDLVNEEGRPLRQPSEASIALIEGFRKTALPTFAVMDGALFSDLPKSLEERKISSRSLFLDHPDAEIARAAALFIPIENETTLTKLLSVPKAENAVVFWSSSAGEDKLFRHLRGINVILIPDDESILNEENDTELSPLVSTEQSVLFRHYDPNVIEATLPLLTTEQFVRLMGPCDQIMWFSLEKGARRRALRPENDVVVPRGPLRLTDEQIEELEFNRKASAQSRRVNYLRVVEPDRTRLMSDTELYRFSATEVSNGESLGLRSERSLTLWVYLQLHSDGKIGRDPGLRGYPQSFPEDGTPDDKIYLLMTRLSALPASTKL